jgi:hypothetical protein
VRNGIPLAISIRIEQPAGGYMRATYTLIILPLITGWICFANATSNAAEGTYFVCLNEAQAIGLGTGPSVQDNCKTAQEKGFIQEFSQCLTGKPSILMTGPSFQNDCFERSQEGTSQVYIRCLQKISSLNISSIGPSFMNLAYNATAQQCDGLVSCLTSYQKRGIQAGPSAVDDCAKLVSLSEDRAESAPKVPSESVLSSDPSNIYNGAGITKFEVHQKTCIFDETGKQIVIKSPQDYQDYMKNFVMKGSRKVTSGPCP